MSRRVARPYAQALFAVVKAQGDDALKKTGEALAKISEVFTALPELLRVFELPSLNQKQKSTILRDIGERFALPVPVRRLLDVLQAHYRLRLFPLVASEFQLACDRFLGVSRGRVEVPTALTPEAVAALAETLKRFVGGEVVLEQEVRAELLAGFVVRLGSLVIDGSLKRQVERFAET